MKIRTKTSRPWYNFWSKGTKYIQISGRWVKAEDIKGIITRYNQFLKDGRKEVEDIVLNIYEDEDDDYYYDVYDAWRVYFFKRSNEFIGNRISIGCQIYTDEDIAEVSLHL